MRVFELPPMMDGKTFSAFLKNLLELRIQRLVILASILAKFDFHVAIQWLLDDLLEADEEPAQRLSLALCQGLLPFQRHLPRAWRGTNAARA